MKLTDEVQERLGVVRGSRVQPSEATELLFNLLAHLLMPDERDMPADALAVFPGLEDLTEAAERPEAWMDRELDSEHAEPNVLVLDGDSTPTDGDYVSQPITRADVPSVPPSSNHAFAHAADSRKAPNAGKSPGAIVWGNDSPDRPVPRVITAEQAHEAKAFWRGLGFKLADFYPDAFVSSQECDPRGTMASMAEHYAAHHAHSCCIPFSTADGNKARIAYPQWPSQMAVFIVALGTPRAPESPGPMAVVPFNAEVEVHICRDTDIITVSRELPVCAKGAYMTLSGYLDSVKPVPAKGRVPR